MILKILSIGVNAIRVITLLLIVGLITMHVTGFTKIQVELSEETHSHEIDAVEGVSDKDATKLVDLKQVNDNTDIEQSDTSELTDPQRETANSEVEITQDASVTENTSTVPKINSTPQAPAQISSSTPVSKNTPEPVTPNAPVTPPQVPMPESTPNETVAPLLWCNNCNKNMPSGHYCPQKSEPITPPPQEPPPARTICNTCGADITDNLIEHGTAHLLNDEPFSYRVE
jgi:cytoskeletal protein RodZ